MSEPHPPWSTRRRRLLLWLALGAVLGGLGAVGLPGELGVTTAFLGALCAFLLVVALVVFLTVPGPDTLGTLLRTAPLAGAVLVVAVLLVLSNPTVSSLRWLCVVASVAAVACMAFVVWEICRSGG